MIKQAFVINLKKRKDRLQKFMLNYKNLKDMNIHVFEAIDPHNFIENKDKTICKNYQFDNSIIDKFKGTIGEVGCFLSHYLLWKECIKRNEEILIFEDDCIVSDNFYILNSALKYKENISNDTEIIWVGTYQPSKQHRDIYPKIKDFTKYFHKIHLDYKQCLYPYCYIIYPKIASKLCKIVEETNMNLHAVDHFMCENTGNNNNHVIFTNNTSDIKKTFICTAFQGDSDVQNTPNIKIHKNKDIKS